MKRLCPIVLTCLVMVALVHAEEVPTIEAVCKAPADFENRVLIFDGAFLSGKLVKGTIRYRLTVKSPRGTVVDHTGDKGILFITTHKFGDQKLQGLDPKKFYPVKLICKIGQAKGPWRANVTKIEFLESRGKEKVVQTPKTKKNLADGTLRNDDKAGTLTTVVAEGLGKDAGDALKEAFRNAVRQVVGAVVDAETLVKNDEVISEKVLTYSDGIIKTYEEVSKKNEKGLVRVKIKASVERRSVIEKLKAAKVSVKEIDGKAIFAEVTTDLEAGKNAKGMVEKLLKDYPPHSLLKAEVVTEDGKSVKVVKNTDKDVTIQISVRVEADEKAYKQFSKKAQALLARLAKKKGDCSKEVGS